MIQDRECLLLTERARNESVIEKVNCSPGMGGTIERASASSDRSFRTHSFIADKGVLLVLKYMCRLVFFSDDLCQDRKKIMKGEFLFQSLACIKWEKNV